MDPGPTENRSKIIPHRTGWPRAEFVTAVVAVLTFVNVLPNEFCYDDEPIVKYNPLVNDPGGWRAIWTTDHWSATGQAWPGQDLLYRPAALSSYRLVGLIAGVDPLPHHILNLMLHALVSVLVVRLCRRVGGSDAAAWVAGLTFAVLPIHTEVVAGVVGRADLLATLGILASVLFHRWALSVGNPTASVGKPTASVACYGLAALAAFGAMCSKESGVSVVPIVILLDALWFRRGSRRQASGQWRRGRWIMRWSYLAVPLGLYLLLRYHALDGRLIAPPPLTKTINVLVDAPARQHLLGVLQLWGMYWEKSFWPSVLTIKYSINSIHLAHGVFDRQVMIGVSAAVLLLLGSTAAWRRGRRQVALVSLAMAVCYAPTSNALVLMQVFFAERIWYAPSTFGAILLGLAVGASLRRRSWRIVAVLLALAMMARCWTRSAEWRNNGTLYAAAYRDQPDAVGPLHLYGQWLVRQGQFERGVELLQRAIEIDPGYTDAHRSLGRAHFATGRYEAAVGYLQIADMQVPGRTDTVQALGKVCRELSDRNRSELDRLRQTALDSPRDVQAELAVIHKLREFGCLSDALDRLRARESNFQDSAPWQAQYAETLLYRNDLDGAIERYRKGLALSPDDPQRLVELAMLLRERSQGDDLEAAWQLATHASKLAPNAPSVLACRAELLVQQGDVTGAVELYGKAIQALPPGGQQRRVFEQRARTLGG